MRALLACLILILVLPIVVAIPSFLTSDSPINSSRITLPLRTIFTDNAGEQHIITVENVNSHIQIIIEKAVSVAAPESVEIAYTSFVSAEGVLYGQVLDANGNPLGGKQITVDVAQEGGGVIRYNATTITRAQALREGNGSLEGFYFVNINAKPPTATTKPNIPQAPSRTIVENATQPQGQAPAVQKNESEYNKEVATPTPPPLQKVQLRESSRVRALATYVAVLALIFVIVWSILMRKKPKSAGTLIGRVGRLRGQRVTTFMDEKPLVVSEDTTLRALLVHLSAQPVLLLEREGELRATASANGALSRIKEGIPKDTTAHNIMHPIEHTLNPTSTFADAVSTLLRNQRGVVAVLKKKKLLGAIQLKHVMAVADKFFSLNSFTLSNPPIVKFYVQPSNIVHEKAQLKDILIALGDSPIVLVINDAKRLQGVITRQALCEEVYNYETQLEHRHAEDFMTKNYRIASPGMSIIEINRTMYELDIEAMPVVLGDDIVGMISQQDVLRALSDIFAQILALEKKK